MTDARSKNFGNTSVELDAIEPDQLRKLVREVIEQHLPQDQFYVFKVAEAIERRYARGWAGHRCKEKFVAWPTSRFVEPLPPDDAVRSWARSRQLAYAKAMAKQGAA